MPLADDLLPGCTVRIDVRGVPSGTGFFVAPGLIVTCAHVIEARGDPKSAVNPQQIEAVVGDERYPVDVKRFQPGREVDLAVLNLLSSVDHPSVLLDDSRVVGRDRLTTFGYPKRHPEGVPRWFVADGRTGSGEWALSEGQVQPGMSGGPLLNERTGGVCGILSYTRDETQSLGGYAVPISKVLRLDGKIQGASGAYHKTDDRWVTLLTAEQRLLWQATVATQAATEAHTFTVHLGQTDEGWQVTADEPGRAALPPEPVDLNAVKEEVARLFRDWASRGRVNESQQVLLLGGILFSAAFPRGIGARLRELASAPESEPVDVRLRFEPGLDAPLAQLPWEHLCLPDKDRPLYFATDERFRFTRVVAPAGSPAGTAPLSDGLTVTVVSARPPGRGEPQRSISSVAERLARLKLQRFSVEHEEGPDAAALEDRLEHATPDVLHYVGTGQFVDGDDKVALGKPTSIEYVTVEVFVDCLPSPPPRVVVLELCGVPPADVVAADFSVLAQDLLADGVAAVVAFQYPVPGFTTGRFNETLYVELLKGSTIEAAVQEARRGMLRHDTRSPVSPALFVRGDKPLALCHPNAEVESTDTDNLQSAFATANV
jgi:hypothetical protein